MVEIKYENLYGVTLEKLQISERENIELRALCLSYESKVNELNSKIEELSNNEKIDNKEESNREAK